MRDKYKQSVAENEKLKEKLRQVSDSISRGDGQKNKLLNELKRWAIRINNKINDWALCNMFNF